MSCQNRLSKTHSTASASAIATLISCLLMTMSASVQAQSDSGSSLNASHRRLELPEGGSSNIQQQLQMLKQLQSLFGGKPGDQNTVPPVSPGQMEMIRQMMKNFSGQAPEDLMKQLGNLPPGLIEGIANDPKQRQMIKDLLQQFSKDGTLPRGNQASPDGPLPPSKSERPPNGKNSSSANSGDPRSSDNPNTPKQREGAESSPTETKATPNSMEDLLQKMRDFEKQHKPQPEPQPNSDDAADSGGTRTSGPKPSPGSTARPANQSSGNRPPNNQAPDNQGPDNSSTAPKANQPDQGGWSVDDINRRIDELLNQKNGRNNGQKNGKANGSSESASPSSEDSNSNNSENSPPHDTSKGVNSVSEFLKKFGGSFDGQLPVLNESADGSGKPAIEEDRTAAAEERKANQEKVKAELQRKGFRETLKRIARDAQREAKTASTARTTNDGSGGESGSEGMSAAMADALTGITRDLIEMVKDGDITLSGPPDSKTKNNKRRTESSEPSALGTLASSATEFLVDVVTPQEAVTVSASETDTASSEGSGPLLPLAVLMMIVAIGVAAAWKYGVIGPVSPTNRSMATISTEAINKRQDLIQAFHQMALSQGQESRDWWTHQMVVDELIQRKPDAVLSAHQLASAYELARYLPEDVVLTDDQIAAARRALHDFETS